MAVITDPDNLTQGGDVVYNTVSQKVSLYPVGSVVVSTANSGQLYVANNTLTCPAAGAPFNTVTNNDIVVILNTHDAGHYRIQTIGGFGAGANVQFKLLTIADGTPSLLTPTSNTNVTFRVYQDGSNGTADADLDEGYGGDSTGTIRDGVTHQAIYSFTKEEWRSDAVGPTLLPTDDLVRHPIPYEAITSEQFEIGGGAAHADWDWFNDYSRKKVRTGGWAVKTETETTNDLQRYTGIVTLGSLDTDSQVYYQQDSVTTNPTNFDFKGPVNESIEIYVDNNQDGAPDTNRTTFLKLFVRKKARTYAGSQISDIGVTTIQTIVNRFPLAHVPDAAITATDGQILGLSPFRDTSVVSITNEATANAAGVKVSGALTFSSEGAPQYQTDGVVPGDTLRLTSADIDNGFYTIQTVDSANTLTLSTDFEFTSSGWTTSNTGQTYGIYTPVIVGTKSGGTLSSVTTAGTGNGIEDAGTSGATGRIYDPTNALFASVANTDLLYITNSANNVGLYKIITVNSAANLTINTSDQKFPVTLEGSVEYQVLEPGMYLQFKDAAIQTITPNTSFDATSNTINIEGTLSGDIKAGTIITVGPPAGQTTSNNAGIFTVKSRVDANTFTIVESLSRTETVDSANLVFTEGFIRDIGGVSYGYNWRLFGNNGTLAQCYQFVQHQLRQSTDIDYGASTKRGDITDLLMSFATPTGTGINMIIDDLESNDINNATFQDATGANRNFPFTAAGTLNFNTNLQNDTNAIYRLFFTNAGGNQFGTKDAIIVNDFDGNPISGNIGGSASIAWTFDYDNNVQGGRSAATDAAVVLVCIGLDTAQYVQQTATIARSTGQSITAVAALERNYDNS
jgi:hypothetical protein